MDRFDDAATIANSIVNANSPPPFLSKTYDMVDDPSTDSVISWSNSNNSFVVWDVSEFSSRLLPKCFKHNNITSFIRQLNTYTISEIFNKGCSPSKDKSGLKSELKEVPSEPKEDRDALKWGFRKVNQDRFEFANERFLRGQKYMLNSIKRQKPSHVHSHNQQQSQVECVEIDKLGIEEEVEGLKRDKNTLMLELCRLKQEQHTTDNQLQIAGKRVEIMEQRQQQMISFLAKAMQSPGFFTQFVQKQNESKRMITGPNKKRRFPMQDEEETFVGKGHGHGGKVKYYQPLMNEAAKAIMRQILKINASPSPSPPEINHNLDAFLIDDVPSTTLENGRSGASLSEVYPDEMNVFNSELVPDEISVVGPMFNETTCMEDPTTRETTHVEDPTTRETTHVEDPTGKETTDELCRDSSDVEGNHNFNLPSINDFFWEQFLQCLPVSPQTRGTDSSDVEGGQDNGWDKICYVNQQMEQMGLLSG